MPRERTQLNINIDPALLVKLKAEAIKSGKTLTDFVVDQLKKAPNQKIERSLEERLQRIEKTLNLEESSNNTNEPIGSIFSDQGAKEYGDLAKKEFDSYRRRNGLTVQKALLELENLIKTNHYPNIHPELIFQILMGNHQLTGSDMTFAYRDGSCAMRELLNDWTKEPLESLNNAFLNAVVIKSLK